MSYTTGLEMILDIERELRARQATHAWATTRSRPHGPSRSLRFARTARAAASRWARSARPAVSPSGSTTACCA